MGRRPGLCGLAGVVLLLGGCTHVNVALNSPNVPLESRVKNHTRASLSADAGVADDNQDGYFVGLALSGGGSRSANFAAACMFELQRIGILDKVDYISSVSGGSLVGVYYCLSGDEWNPGNVQRKLTYSFATDLIVETLLPWNFLVMSLSPWDRSDILADTFRRNLYSRRGRALTFSDLRADRPRLLINATDLQSGRRFVFCNESFDRLNSDLSRYPIAYAVSASAAVPVLLHHVTIRDYSTVFKAYRHLVDGGVSDNLGVLSLVEAYTEHRRAAQEARKPDPYPHGAILIVVDAHTNFDAELGNRPDMGLLEGLAAGAGLTSTALLNRVSSATLTEIIVNNAPGTWTADEVRAAIAELEQEGLLRVCANSGREVRVVHLSLSRVGELKDVPFASFGQRVNNIATYFNISQTEAYNLHKAAELLVQQRFSQPLRAIANDLAAAKPQR